MSTAKDYSFWSFMHVPGFKIGFVMVTPAIAIQMLSCIESNRRKRATKIEAYRAKMTLGEWRISPDCLAFDATGRLVNGQHRLTALVEADVPQIFPVIFGCKNEDVTEFDCGVVRNLEDASHYAGSVLNKDAAATAEGRSCCGGVSQHNSQRDITNLQRSGYCVQMVIYDVPSGATP